MGPHPARLSWWNRTERYGRAGDVQPPARSAPGVTWVTRPGQTHPLAGAGVSKRIIAALSQSDDDRRSAAGLASPGPPDHPHPAENR
ncbi:hypothetical protein SBRY_20287 [Actinacidiphila bryophytorum]|uniref:Uncharacterized protein n=1 Tax=Actinacidiphila bryophytorum TaxID=1436133 RepID=A0A9W4E655_9ACTN|nr:hypothetical protein SBRY_20287 [Actinacidiphila bryophytorum]